jgi:hypothetical protein
VFTGGVATDADLMVASDRALSTLTFPIDSVQNQFTVVDGTKFQVPCLVQIDTEVIKVVASSGDLMQECVRGFANTAAASHGQNAQVKGYVFSYHHNQLAAEVKAIEMALGENLGNVITSDDQANGQVVGPFNDLRIIHNGVTAGTYGAFNMNVILTVDASGLVTSINNAPGNINYPIIYKGAIVQDNNAILGFSYGSTNSPTAVGYTGTSGSVYGVAQFTQGNNYWVQDHFYLPDDWQSDAVSLDIYWRIPDGASGGTTGNVTWTIQTGSLRAGLGTDVVFGSIKSITTTVPATTGVTVKSRITPLFMSGILPGDELFFKFARSNADTCNAPAEMISIKFNINRNFALVQ